MKEFDILCYDVTEDGEYFDEIDVKSASPDEVAHHIDQMNGYKAAVENRELCQGAWYLESYKVKPPVNGEKIVEITRTLVIYSADGESWTHYGITVRTDESTVYGAFADVIVP